MAPNNAIAPATTKAITKESDFAKGIISGIHRLPSVSGVYQRDWRLALTAIMRQAKPELATERPAQMSIMSRNPNTKARSMEILSVEAAVESIPAGTATAASLISFDCRLWITSMGT